MGEAGPEIQIAVSTRAVGDDMFTLWEGQVTKIRGGVVNFLYPMYIVSVFKLHRKLGTQGDSCTRNNTNRNRWYCDDSYEYEEPPFYHMMKDIS